MSSYYRIPLKGHEAMPNDIDLCMSLAGKEGYQDMVGAAECIIEEAFSKDYDIPEVLMPLKKAGILDAELKVIGALLLMGCDIDKLKDAVTLLELE